MTRVDVHQHVWTEPLLGALAARNSLPFIRASGGLTVLHSAGERPYVIDIEAEAPARRRALLDRDGIDLALVSLSSPIGIEALQRDAALELIDAHLEGVGALGGGFAAWGPVALDRVDADDVDALLARGCVGIALPAGALAGPDALLALGPVLERVEHRRVPLFVHPGPAAAGDAQASLTEPLWWRALTDYVAQMQAAWLTFVTFARREHPELVALFAMLAGGAPLLSERLHTRGGPAVQHRDPRIFYDTSSFGPVAIEATARRVGGEQLVFGSDRPVAEPVPSGREAVLMANAARLVSATSVAA